MRQSSKGMRLTVGVLTAFFASAPITSEAKITAAPDGASPPENESLAMSPAPVSAQVSISPAALEKIKSEAEGIGISQNTIHEARSQVTPVRERSSQVTPIKQRGSQVTPLSRRSSQVTPLSRRSSQVTPLKKPSDMIVK
jgi:hypothetical protein